MKFQLKNSTRKLTCYSAMFLFCCISNNTLAAYSWKQKTSFGGTARHGAAYFAINDKGYIGTGWDGSNRKDFWEYDQPTDVWTQKADFGGAVRHNPASFAVGGKGYVGLGTITYPNYTFVSDWWEYDPVSNTWMQKGSFPATSRYTTISFTINGKAYMGTGWNQTLYWRDMWEYDPVADVWTQKADFGGVERQSAIAFAVNGKGYAGTGNNGGNLSDFWEYDPVANVWTAKANFPAPARYGASAFVINNEGYVGCGGNGNSFYTDFYKFDPIGNTWTAIAAFPGTARLDGAGFGIGVAGYVGVGMVNGGMTNTFWEYSPDGIVANFNSAAQNLCPGTCTDFYNLTANATSYLWSFPGANPSVSTDANPTGICYASPGSYDVTLITSDANGSDTLLIQNYITIYPTPAPQGINQNGDTLFANQGSNSYQWYQNGNIINGATNYYYVASSGGYFNVVTTDTNGCQVEAVIYDVVADVAQISTGENYGVSVYPNPFHGNTNIHIVSNENEKVKVEIFDVQGKLVEELFNGQMSKGESKDLEFKVSELTDAVYNYRITNGNNVMNGRLILIK